MSRPHPSRLRSACQSASDFCLVFTRQYRLPSSILSRQFATSKVTMRAFILTAIAAAPALAQTSVVAPGSTATSPAEDTLVTSTHTPTAEAPLFYQKAYIDPVWKTPSPKVELRAPVRIAEFDK